MTLARKGGVVSASCTFTHKRAYTAHKRQVQYKTAAQSPIGWRAAKSGQEWKMTIIIMQENLNRRTCFSMGIGRKGTWTPFPPCRNKEGGYKDRIPHLFFVAWYTHVRGYKSFYWFDFSKYSLFLRNFIRSDYFSLFEFWTGLPLFENSANCYRLWIVNHFKI